MAYVTSWLVGSVAALPDQVLEVDGDEFTLDSGAYYLMDALDSLSLIATFEALLTAAGVADASVFMTKSRHVRITSSGTFAVTWGASTRLRDLLGFTGNLSGASAYQATLVSPLLWSPAKPESSTMAPFGTRGMKVYTTMQSVAPYSGRTQQVSHGYREYNAWFWLNVAISRVWTQSEAPGEFVRWFAEIATTSSRWKLYSQISEEATTSSLPVTISYGGQGPFIYSATRKGVNWSYQRSKGLEWCDRRADIEISAHVCGEYVT